MKILIIPWNVYPENAGGAGKSIYYTAQGLAKLPQVSAVHILTSTRGKTRTERQGKLFIERYKDLNINFITGSVSFRFEDIKRKLNHLKIYKNWEKKIKKKYNQFKPDIIHCNDPFSLRRVRKTLKNINTPIIVSIRGYWACSSSGNMLDNKKRIIENWTLKDTLKTNYLRAPINLYKLYKNKLNLKNVDGIHFVSEYTKNKTEEHVNLSLARKVIMNPRPSQKIKKNKKRDSKTIAYVGELTYKKGLSKLIDALEILIKAGKDYKLLVAGKGTMEKRFKKSVEEKGLSNYVNFLGWVDNPDIVYKQAVITVVPSLFPEPLGSTSEPMGHGSIPLVSNVRGLPEGIPTKELMVDVRNPEKLANKIEEIMENPSKQEKIKKTFKSWLKRFNMENVAKQFLSFYEEVIHNQK